VATYDEWWANRAGTIAAATTTPTRPQPEYGAAVDLSTSPLSAAQYEGLVNDVQAVREEENTRQGWKDRLTFGLWSKAGDFLTSGAGLSPGIGGINPELAMRATGALQDTPVAGAAGAVGTGAMTGLEWFDERVFQPNMRALATPQHVLNIAGEESGSSFWLDWGALVSGETWKEAWERSENATLGQGYADTALDRDLRSQAYSEGFDEFGRPRNQAYAEIRESGIAYNLASGSIDFLKVWYASPDVVALKGIGQARAIYKGDFDRLTRRQQVRVRQIMTTPSENFERIKDSVPVWDVASRRAVGLREEQFRLRDQVRAGELDASGLARFQAFEASAQGPTAAHLFAEASKARQIDPRTGQLGEAFDDDLFDTVTAAMIGHRGAINRLGERADEIGDGIRAMNDTRIAALDEAVEMDWKILDIQTTPHLTDAERADALVAPQWRLDRAVEKQMMAEAGLKRYQGYEDWVHRALVEGPQLSMAPREAYSFSSKLQGATAMTYRPTGHADRASQIIQIPRAAWLKRAGAANLHNAEEAFESTARMLDGGAYYGRGANLDEVANTFGAESWDALNRDLSNRIAGASDDVQRSVLLHRAEDVAMEAVATKHGMDRDSARALLDHVRSMRADLVRQAQGSAQKSYSQAKTPDGNRIDTFRHVNADGTEEILRLPVDVTQLENTFIPVDLRVVDQLLAQHGNSIRAALWDAPKGGITQALETFNHYWKPSVLFRMGYPVRNLADDGARAVAAAMSASYLVGTAKAVGIGARNIPTRMVNRYGRTRGWFTDNRPGREPAANPQAIRDSLGPIDAPDTKRLTTLRNRVSQLDTFDHKSARTAALGRKVPEKTIPAILRQLNNRLDELGDEIVPVDAVNGRVRGGDKWRVAFDDSVQVFDQVDARGLTRYIDEHAEILSNQGNAVLLRRLGDGRVEASIGRRALVREEARPDTTRALREPGTRPVRVGGEEFEGAFGPHGDMYRPANSSEQFNANLYRSQQYNLREARRDNLQRTVHAGEDDFESAWAMLVNDQLRKSPIIRRMLDGASDEEIVRWLGNTADGRRLAKRIPHKSHNPVRWVDELRLHLNHYLPSERLRVMARDGDLDPDELRKLGQWDERPISVDSSSVKMSAGTHSMSQMINKQIDRIFKGLATVPTDSLVRNPFFERNYRYRLRQMMDLDPATPMTERTRAVMEKQAREYALKQTKKYMFSLADQSELTHMLRFISPFIGSWQESIVRWFRIVMERPEAFARMYVQGWEGAPDKIWGVEQYQDPMSGDDMIRVPLPKPIMGAVAKLLPGVDPEDLEGFENMIIPKQSLNVTLQGSPWWLPGGGPLVQAPAAYFLRNSPELQDEDAFTAFAWKWLFPAGRPKVEENALLAIAPSWVQQAMRYHAEGNDPVYNNLGLLVYKNDHQRWRDSGRPADEEPTIQQAFDKAKGIQLFYTAGRLGSPFAFRLEPASQLWIDKAREYRELYGFQEGLQRFAEDMGEDAYLWWSSLSQTNLAVPPTSEGFSRYKAAKDQIEAHPELAALIIGLDAADAEFNSSVYSRQQDLPVSPWDPRKQRAQKTPQDLLAEVETQQGWAEYRNWKAGLDAELAARGLTSINQKGAEDLLWANRAFVSEQKDKLPGWGRDFESFDSGKGYAYVSMLRDWIGSGSAPIYRPDIADELARNGMQHHAVQGNQRRLQIAGGAAQRRGGHVVVARPRAHHRRKLLQGWCVNLT
jgi:hypothetical protein